jgi:hypothetical protein
MLESLKLLTRYEPSHWLAQPMESAVKDHVHIEPPAACVSFRNDAPLKIQSVIHQD